MLKITEHILETKKEDFDPLEARYRMILIEKLRDKQARCRPGAWRPLRLRRTSST
jgi:hypothetical protein